MEKETAMKTRTGKFEAFSSNGRDSIVPLVLLLIVAAAALLIAAFAEAREPLATETRGPGWALLKAEPDKKKPLRLSETAGGDDRTLAPYFYVPGGEEGLDELPLKATRADVEVAGVIASVTVTQVYKNDGDKTLEAIYVFPASTRAAVHAMRMTIGERTIEAQIKKREEARRDYETAREQGRTASLLEQQRPNVFQMNVANIQPGDEIHVEMNYTELLVPEDGVYEFVFPTVVGPRYSNESAENAPANKRWVESPYLTEGQGATYTFGLALTLHGGVPVAKLSSPSHDIWADWRDEKTVDVALDEDAANGNRDFVLRYALKGKAIQSGALVYEHEDENFFLVMLQPPKRVTAAEIPPREYVFILDVSGSMHGFPLDTTKALMRDLMAELRPSDHFNILFFSGGNFVLSEKPLPATPENVKRAMATIENQQGGGGTELLPAMQRALALPKAEGASRIVVVATDGYVTVEKEAFEYIREHLGDANLFPFGIGSSVNRFLIEGMARAGLGEPFVVLNPEQAKTQAKRFKDYIAAPVLTDIEVHFDGIDAYDVEPPAAPDLFAERPLVLFGKFNGSAEGRIVVEGRTPDGAYEERLELAESGRGEENSALRALWARERVARLADMNKLAPEDERVGEVTELGLRYSLLTDYTSFVAVDSLVRGDGHNVTVKQPLPLPDGVSNYAVGGATGATGFASPMQAAPKLRTAVAEEAEDSSSIDGLLGRGGAGGIGTVGRGYGGAIRKESEKRYEGKKKDADKNASSVAIGKIEVANAFDAAAVSRLLAKLQGQLRHAFQKALQKNPALRGALKVELAIGANGRVQQATVKSDSLKNKSMEKDVLDVLKRLAFPVPKDGKPAAITITLTFGSQT